MGPLNSYRIALGVQTDANGARIPVEYVYLLGTGPVDAIDRYRQNSGISEPWYSIPGLDVIVDGNSNYIGTIELVEPQEDPSEPLPTRPSYLHSLGLLSARIGTLETTSGAIQHRLIQSESGDFLSRNSTHVDNAIVTLSPDLDAPDWYSVGLAGGASIHDRGPILRTQDVAKAVDAWLKS